MYDATITFRTTTATKQRAAQLFEELGMDTSTALNIFLKRTLAEQGLPFSVSLPQEPNAETLAAIKETYEHPETTEGPYTTTAEILEALHA